MKDEDPCQKWRAPKQLLKSRVQVLKVHIVPKTIYYHGCPNEGMHFSGFGVQGPLASFFTAAWSEYGGMAVMMLMFGPLRLLQGHA